MNDSLVQQDYLTISNSGNLSGGFTAQDITSFTGIDTVTMANISAASSGLGNVTISTMAGSNYYYNTGAGIGGSSGTISVGTISGGTFTIGGAGTEYNWKNEEFVDTLPNFDRIKKMCEQYPGFKIAFEKFKTTYYLVKDDYDTPEDKRPRP
jgi:hypothetical protein